MNPDVTVQYELKAIPPALARQMRNQVGGGQMSYLAIAAACTVFGNFGKSWCGLLQLAGHPPAWCPCRRKGRWAETWWTKVQ